MADSATNAKTTLVELCQRYCGKSMGKADIVYQVAEYDGKFQATVRLDCIEGQEFAGELTASPKEAEQAAAYQALEGLRQEIGAGTIMMTAAKRKAASEDTPDLSIKSKLREACKQILGRDLTDGDMVYEVSAVDGGQVATLKLPTLPGVLGVKTWTGSISPYKRDTMLVAASEALEAILADPQHGISIDLSKVPNEEAKKEIKKKSSNSGGSASKNASKTWGKSTGKGAMWNQQMWEWMMMMMGWDGNGKGCKGKGKGWDEGWDPMWGGGWGGKNGWGGCTGKGGCGGFGAFGGGAGGGAGACGGQPQRKKRKGGGPDLPRERVTETPVTGDVVEWKGKFGWIKPHEMINHSASSKNQGKVYVHIKDIPGADSLAKGAAVQFQAYADSSGLGAEEVVVL